MKVLFQKKQTFVGFIVGGDGGTKYCVDCGLQLIDGGVDILEIGFPFSDPVSDGPIIQHATAQALNRGVNAATMLEIACQIRKKSDAPLVLFSYYNPLLQLGNSYLTELKAAGFDALLVVDCAPSQDEHSFFEDVRKAGLYPIFVIAPSTDEARIIQIAQKSQGFIYYACQKGTTGIRNKLPEDFSSTVTKIRKHSSLPIVAGFGIADCESAKSALKHTDGFVVGSAFVRLMEKQVDPHELRAYAQSIDPRAP
jgi:tryptophan synthase alpha chain